MTTEPESPRMTATPLDRHGRPLDVRPWAVALRHLATRADMSDAEMERTHLLANELEAVQGIYSALPVPCPFCGDLHSSCEFSERPL